MATYHGIIRAACLTCRYSTIDDTTLEVWNDAPLLGFCPNCHGVTGQTLWVTTDAVRVCSFVDADLVSTTDLTGESAFGFRAIAVCERVASLIPGATSNDDGGGEYVTVDGLPVELFPCPPDNAPTPEQGGRWTLQFDGGEQVHVSDLTIDADPADVVAWALPILHPEPATPAPAPGIHTLSEWNVNALAETLTAAASTKRLVRVAWDGGLKVKVGEGVWTPILSKPED